MRDRCHIGVSPIRMNAEIKRRSSADFEFVIQMPISWERGREMRHMGGGGVEVELQRGTAFD